MVTAYDREVLQLFRSRRWPGYLTRDGEPPRTKGSQARVQASFQAFLGQIGFKGSLKTFGFPAGELPALAKPSMVLPDYTNSPKAPTPEDLYEVLAHSFRPVNDAL